MLVKTRRVTILPFTCGTTTSNTAIARFYLKFPEMNLHTYHYAGNNPVKLSDPDGNYLINNVDAGVYNATDYANDKQKTLWTNPTAFLRNNPTTKTRLPAPSMVSTRDRFVANNYGIILENGLNEALKTAIEAKDDRNPNTSGKIVAYAEKMDNGRYKINITVSSNRLSKSISGTIAFAAATEIEKYASHGEIDYDAVKRIANETINIVRDTFGSKNNIDDVLQ